MTGLRINIYVTQDERQAFDAYARSLGLDVGGLANLVLRRGLRQSEHAGVPGQSPVNSGSARMKITLHDVRGDLRPRLEAMARTSSLSLSGAGAVLVRRELKERWLERAINQDDSK